MGAQNSIKAGVDMRIATLLAAAGALALSGCASGLGLEQRQARERRVIADDVLSLNQAYGEVVAGQILLNILRARDRLPTQYVAVSQIQRTSTVVDTQRLSLGGVELGDIGSPWAEGDYFFERKLTPHPNYTVAPFSAEDARRIMFRPIEPQVFADYWNAGWPSETLLLLLVERIVVVERRIGAAVNIVADLGNDAGDFANNCAEDVDTEGCRFVRQARSLAAAARGKAPDRRIDLSGVCGLAAAYDLPATAAPNARRTGQTCDAAARIIVGQTEYTLTLRTLDDIVFYIGELLRSGPGGEGGAYEAPVLVGAAGLPGGGAGVPLFRVVDRAGAQQYAASVIHNGVRYYSGPAVSRECGREQHEGACADTHELGDRSSLVLALLSQILLRNQSSDSQPRPPLILISP